MGSSGVGADPPLDDRSHYAASLAAHGGKPHFHHIKVPSENYDDALDGLVSDGHGILQSGTIYGIPFAYTSTGDLPGCTVEVSGRSSDMAIENLLPEPEVFPAV